MKPRTLITIVILVTLIYSLSILAKSKSVVRTHVLRVESVNSANENIPFTFVYSLRDSNSTKELITEMHVTPFKMVITSECFTGLIQDKSLKGELEVTLDTYENGIECKWVKSQFKLNVIRINKDESYASSY